MADELTIQLLNNRYRILSQLGKGAMGEVYHAFDTSLDQEVAVKCNRMQNEQSTSQFLREARLLASLRHPHLPRVIDYFVIGSNQYLVMDYVPGDDLARVVERDGAQPLERVMAWMKQLGGALEYLHHQKPPVIHRDIKPANIKLTPNGDVMLVDFGIAKVADVSQATATGAMGYTPGYAPPEQYGSGGHTGPYSDQYALAATFYVLVTGQRPAESMERLLNNVPLKPLREWLPSIPPQVDAAVQRAMALRPAERFASVDQFVHALHAPASAPAAVVHPAAISPATVVAQVPAATAAHRPKKTSRPWGWYALAGGIGLLLLGFVCAGSLYLAGVISPTLPAAFSPGTNQAVEPSIAAPQPSVPPTGIPAASTAAPPPQENTPTPLPSPTFTPEATATLQPSATPAAIGGSLLVFSSDRADGKTLQLWSMYAVQNSDNSFSSSNLTQLTFTDGDKSQASWSPDGKTLLFSAPGGANTGLDIWKLDLSQPGNPPARVTNMEGDESEPAFSSDGKLIVFINFGRFQPVHQMYLMNADGSDLQRLSLDFNERSPVFSQDDEVLLYVVKINDHNFFYTRKKKDLYKTPSAYDRVEIFGRQGEVDHPAWSPDGEYIAYTRIEGKTERIYTLRYKSGGSDMLLLSEGAFLEQNPTWSRDGQWLAFTSRRDGNEEIYLMTSTGKLQSNLTNSPGRDLDPAWQP